MNLIKYSRTTRYVTLSRYYHVSSHESNTYDTITVLFSSYSRHELVSNLFTSYVYSSTISSLPLMTHAPCGVYYSTPLSAFPLISTAEISCFNS